MVKVYHDLRYDIDHSGVGDRDHYGDGGKKTKASRQNNRIGRSGYCGNSELHYGKWRHSPNNYKSLCRSPNSSLTRLSSGNRAQPCPEAYNTFYNNNATLACEFDINKQSVRDFYEQNQDREGEYAKNFKQIRDEFCKNPDNLFAKFGGQTCNSLLQDQDKIKDYCRMDNDRIKSDDNCKAENDTDWYQELAEIYCRNHPTDSWCKCYNVKNYKDVCMESEVVKNDTTSCPAGSELKTISPKKFIPDEYAAINLQLEGAGCIGQSDEKKDNSWIAKNYANHNCSQDWQLMKYDPETNQLKLKGKVDDKELCLDHAHYGRYVEGDAVHFGACHGGLNQKWYLDSKDRLKTFDLRANHLCLDKAYNDTRKERFQMWTCNDNKNQKFKSSIISDKKCVTTSDKVNDLPGCGQAIQSVLAIAQYDSSAKSLLLDNPQCIAAACPQGSTGYLNLKESAFNQCRSMNICNQNINVGSSTNSKILAKCAISSSTTDASGSSPASGSPQSAGTLADTLADIDDQVDEDEDEDEEDQKKDNTAMYAGIASSGLSLSVMMGVVLFATTM